MHLDGGFTKVLLESTAGAGMADGGLHWDVPTDKIPAHLRAIGTRFVVAMRPVVPEAADAGDDLRAAVRDFTIKESEASAP